MQHIYKEVRFDLYCDKCKYKDVDDVEEPCNECLTNTSNLFSVRPVKFEEKED